MPYNLDSTNSRLVVVGAGDAALHYTGNWAEDWESGPGDALWKSTTSSDSVSFQFRGTRILLCIVSTPNTTSSPPTVRWLIDNESPVTTSVQPSSSGWSFQTLIDQPNLSDDTHTINMTLLQVSSGYPFLLDSFAFAPSSKFWSEALLTPPGPVSGTSMAAIIVGGIMGGVVLALACMSCTIWLRRRRARRFLYSTISETEDNTRKISPFTFTSRPPGARLASSPATSIPRLPPPATEVSSTRATITSQDPNEVQDSRGGRVPTRKRKGYRLRSSQHLRSLRALVYRSGTDQTVSTSSAPSTPPPGDITVAAAHLPGHHASEPPTPPPLYTA